MGELGARAPGGVPDSAAHRGRPGRRGARIGGREKPFDLVHDLVYFGGVTEVNVHEAKTHLSRLLARVESGEEILISRAGQPVARLVPARRARGKRRPGRFVGKGRIADDFNAPLPPEVLAEFLK